MSATSASSTTDFTWDSVSGENIPLDINDATTTSGTSNTSYLYGDLHFGGTAPIEQITTTSGGTTVSYLVANQVGVQGVYNGSGSSLGAVQEMAVYSLYGNQTINSGSKVTPFGFQGSYADSTGLIYLINRYYDPTTDQFLSIDPDLAQTDQPYIFTNDDPLNAEDPTGLLPFASGNESNAQIAAIARAVASAEAARAAAVKKSNEAVAQKIIKTLDNSNFTTSGTAADVYHQIVKDTSTPFDAISASDATRIVESAGVAAGKYAAGVTAIGGALTYYNDVQYGYSPAYAAGDVTFTLGGALGGAALCGGPEDGVGIVCGLVGGFVGGALGHDIWSAIS